MAILAECDICGSQHRVKDSLGGGSVRCKDCGSPITVHKENVISSEDFYEENGRLMRRQPEKVTGSWSWLLPCLSFVFVVTCLSGFLWGLFQLIRFK